MIETDGVDRIKICVVILHHKKDLIVLWESAALILLNATTGEIFPQCMF